MKIQGSKQRGRPRKPKDQIQNPHSIGFSEREITVIESVSGDLSLNQFVRQATLEKVAHLKAKMVASQEG